MTFSLIFFILVGAISLAAAIGVVVSRQPVHSALFLLTNFAMLAALYITLDAQFLGAIQVIIYAGGIVILILFVIMLIGSGPIETKAGHRSWIRYVALGLGILLLVGLALSIAQSFGGATPNAAAIQGGVPPVVGMELYTKYILPFELVGILLLVALIGALLVARRPKEKAQS
jgi:NADH-quinone oxidoreductase subunit J